MEELIYLLKVAHSSGDGVKERLLLDATPSHVRVSTLAPLSNFGYTPDAEGALLGINQHGLIVGVEGRPQIPRAFIPWQNVAYIADGAGLNTP